MKLTIWQRPTTNTGPDILNDVIKNFNKSIFKFLPPHKPLAFLLRFCANEALTELLLSLNPCNIFVQLVLTIKMDMKSLRAKLGSMIPL